MTELAMYKEFAAAVKVPVLANITEFGATPLFTTDELASADVSLVLYPLSAFRAMNKAAENVYTAIRRDGAEERDRYHADPHGAVRSHRLPQLRAEARRALRAEEERLSIEPGVRLSAGPRTP